MGPGGRSANAYPRGRCAIAGAATVWQSKWSRSRSMVDPAMEGGVVDLGFR
jgi:hypothetical protein